MANISEFLSVCEGNVTSNETSQLWVLPDSDRTSGLVTAVFLLLILVTALPWNLLVVVIILKEKLFKQPTILLLLNLVLTDLVIILVMLPFEVATGLQGEFVARQSDHVRCELCNFGVIIVIFALMSLLTVAFMSFDRFLFIYKPLKYHKIITSFRVFIVLSVMWIISTVLSVLPLIKVGNIVFFPPLLSCVFNFSLDGSLYPILILVTVSLTIIFSLVFNLWVAVIVQKNIRAIYKARKSDKDHYKRMKKRRQDKELHLIKVFSGLLCSNLICWLPTMIVISYVSVSNNGRSVPIEVYSTVNVLFLSQALLHPFIETALVRDVKEPIKKLVLCYRYRKHANSVSHQKDDHCCNFKFDRPCCNCDFLTVLGMSLLPNSSFSDASQPKS